MININKNIILGIVVVFVALIGAIIYFQTNKSTIQNVYQSTASSLPQSSPQVGASQSAASNSQVKEFSVVGANYSFQPNMITVNKGDTVKINFKDSDGRHNLIIDGYNQGTNTILTGETSTIQFVADKQGEFEYYCSVGNHRQLGMRGTLVVK